MKAKHLIALAVFTPVYWAVAIPAAIIVGWEMDFQCTRGAPTLHPCYITKFLIPALFLLFAYVYAWIIWTIAQRAERDHAEMNRLSSEVSASDGS